MLGRQSCRHPGYVVTAATGRREGVRRLVAVTDAQQCLRIAPRALLGPRRRVGKSRGRGQGRMPRVGAVATALATQIEDSLREQQPDITTKRAALADARSLPPPKPVRPA